VILNVWLAYGRHSYQGREEFVILLPDTAMAVAMNVAERIRREIETQGDKTLPAYTVSPGLSVTQGDAGQAANMEALIAEADAALYRAKQGGRNRVEAWSYGPRGSR